MTEHDKYTNEEFRLDVGILARRVNEWMGGPQKLAIHGIPRGGLVLAEALAARFGSDRAYVATTPVEIHNAVADGRVILLVDDIVDTGATMHRAYNEILKNHPGCKLLTACLHYNYTATAREPFYVSRRLPEDPYIDYWWEESAEKDAEDLTIRRLELIGEDPNREGLKDTPARVERAWSELTSGYGVDVEKLFTTFTIEKKTEQDEYDEIVLLKDIEFYSLCEHHLLPFFGKAHIAYMPADNVIGVSKLARILDVFSKRLQIQERLCDQVTDALMSHLVPYGAACIIEAQHLCMKMRGVGKQSSVMVTSSVKGKLRNAAAKTELMRLIG